MQLQRNEILTGLLVLVTVAVLTGILILLGAPGLFRPLVTYKIYMDNAAGIKLGAPVLLAGRKIGQVEKLYSPVSKEDAARAEAAAALRIHSRRPTRATDPRRRTKPKYEARIDVRVDKDARRLQGRQGAADHTRSPGRNGHRLYPGQRQFRARQRRRNVCRRARPRLRRIDFQNARYREASGDGSDRDVERAANHGAAI